MKNMGFGLQLYSVRNVMGKEEWDTLRKVAALSYKQVELCAGDFVDGRPDPVHSAADDKKLYDDLGLRRLSIAMPVNFHRFMDDWKHLTEYSNQICCEAICCSVATFENGDEARRLADFFNEIGRFAVENGQKFYYHNHYHEFQNIRGEVPMDPLAYMDRLGSRLGLVHQKDLSANVDPVNVLARVPEGTNLDWDGFVKYTGKPADFVELGRGTMDVPSIVKKARSMDSVISVVIEQDQTAIGGLESVKINYEYLSKLIWRKQYKNRSTRIWLYRCGKLGHEACGKRLRRNLLPAELQG